MEVEVRKEVGKRGEVSGQTERVREREYKKRRAKEREDITREVVYSKRE